MQGYQELEVEIRGVCPTMINNGHLADPTNKWAKAIKEITS